MIFLNTQTINVISIILIFPMLIFIIFPNNMIPPSIVQKLLSPLGIVLLFIITILFFLFTHILFSCAFLVTVYVLFTRYSSIYNNSRINVNFNLLKQRIS